MSTAVLVEGDGRLLASVSAVDLLRTASDRPLRDLVQEKVPPHLHADEGLEQVALLMADFNLTAARWSTTPTAASWGSSPPTTSSRRSSPGSGGAASRPGRGLTA